MKRWKSCKNLCIYLMIRNFLALYFDFLRYRGIYGSGIFWTKFVHLAHSVPYLLALCFINLCFIKSYLFEKLVFIWSLALRIAWKFKSWMGKLLNYREGQTFFVLFFFSFSNSHKKLHIFVFQRFWMSILFHKSDINSSISLVVEI